MEGDFADNLIVDEKDSTTAGVFNALDQTASKTEAWFERNQKVIFGLVVVIAVVAIGWLCYNKFVAEPKEEEAATEIYTAQQHFEQASNGVKPDSLYPLALNGAGGKYGFLKVADVYSGTKAGNLAHYYAGMCYLHTGKFDKAIEYLERYKADDEVTSVLAIGAIGDARAEKNDLKGALEQYKQAAEMKKNDFTTPHFLLKAGKTELALGNKAEALKYFTTIKDDYSTSVEAQGLDAFIGLAQ